MHSLCTHAALKPTKQTNLPILNFTRVVNVSDCQGKVRFRDMPIQPKGPSVEATTKMTFSKLLLPIVRLTDFIVDL
jgi:hypothetical protein